MSAKHGKIIVFDGPDGVGKTTQIELTARYVHEQGLGVHTTRASGGTPIGEKLRRASLSDIPRAPEVDVYISLAMHTELGHDLQRRKKQGQICLVDRSPAAILAYNTYGSQLNDKQLGFNAFEDMLRLWGIDLFLMIDANQSVIDRRRAKRTDKQHDYFEKQGKAYHQRVREGYAEATKQIENHPDWDIDVTYIDGAPVEEVVQQQVRQAIKKVLY